MFDIYPLILEPTRLNGNAEGLPEVLQEVGDLLGRDARANDPIGYRIRTSTLTMIPADLTQAVALARVPEEQAAGQAPGYHCTSMRVANTQLGKRPDALKAIRALEEHKTALVGFTFHLHKAIAATLNPTGFSRHKLQAKTGKGAQSVAITANLMALFRADPLDDQTSCPVDFCLQHRDISDRVRDGLDAGFNPRTDLVLPVFIYRAQGLTAHARLAPRDSLDAEIKALETLILEDDANTPRGRFMAPQCIPGLSR